MGLFPERCTHNAIDMVLLANQTLEKNGLRPDDFATEAFRPATELQLLADM